MTTEQSLQKEEQVVGRRAALRGAAVLAGAAGLGAAAVAGAGSASAAPGDPVTQGAANDAGATTTRLTSAAVGSAAATAGSTLALANTADGAPLRVAATLTPPPNASVAGEYRSVDVGGGFVLPVYNHMTGDGTTTFPLHGGVFTEVWALQPIPVIPQRVLNTTTVAGRSRVTDPAGKFDSAGRLLAGKSITLSLLDLVIAGGAVLGNLTAVGSLAAGHLTIYPADPRPGTSSVNYAKGQTIPNFTFTGMTVSATNITVKIFASATTHVVFDVTGFAVGSPTFINPGILQAAAVSPAAAQVSPTALPAWARGQRARRLTGR